MPFELFDRDAEVRITAGHLPHWYQPGVTYFITFRTDDSLPVAVAETWYRRRDEWLQQHGIDPHANWTSALKRLPEIQQAQFHRTFSREFMELLDKGHGACVLRRVDVAETVERTLLFDDGRRCRLLAWVIMPNHVHLLVEMWQTPLNKLLHSWKTLTSKRANALLGRSGQLWQEDYRDRYMRDETHYRKTVRYIENNPVKAGLVQSPETWRFGNAWWRVNGVTA